MKRKKPLFPITYKCWYCGGGYHTATKQDVIIISLINLVLIALAILRSCGAA